MSSESPSGYEDCNIAPPSRDEVIHAIKLLKNNKSPGIDELPAELLKALPEVAIDELYNLLTDVWVNEYIPEEWRTSVIIPVFKKGDRADYTNYRGISLILNSAKELPPPYSFKRNIGRQSRWIKLLRFSIQ
ncbi:hypothetical protein QYM36_016128 [Artemia franciscana]|uniref:RNA-directed DNA polymerase from mobile element jockey n=1 Tax=Artemia franciscana TaxID=6661 RepID=A0AA88H717_ARTSF|nr:hypothetical protein QYM36_016128 [Artemia franciscana]